MRPLRSPDGGIAERSRAARRPRLAAPVAAASPVLAALISILLALTGCSGPRADGASASMPSTAPTGAASPSTAGPGTTPSTLAAGPGTTPSSLAGPATTPAPGGIPPFDHIVVLVEENHGLDSIIGNPDAPYLNSLASSSALATRYRATTHPSLPNYLELTSGTTAGITDDCNPPGGSCSADVANIADQLERTGRSWKAYLDGMPAPCTVRNSGTYAVKHNPFLYYPAVRNDPARCQAHDVPLDQLDADLTAPGALPDYSFVVPDLCHDMHDCPVRKGDAWLGQLVPRLLASDAFTRQRSLLVITFDESEGGGANIVPTLFVGPDVRAGFVTTADYGHDALLHTIEAAWGLPPLTPAVARAPLIGDIVR